MSLPTANNGVRLVARSALFMAGVFAMLWALTWLLTPSNGTIDPWPAVRQLKDQVDVIVLGSSHAHCTVSPLELWRENGITATDVSGGGQVISATLASLKTALRYQKPKVVMLEVHMVGGRTAFEDLPRAHTNLDYIPLGIPRLVSIADSVPATAWPEFVMPLQAYHSRWPQLTRYDFYPLKRSSLAYARGGINLPQIEPLSGETTKTAVVLADYEKDLVLVRELADVCERSGARLVLFSAPTYSEQFVGDRLLLDRLQADLSADHPEVDYLNMNGMRDEAKLDPKTDYKDAHHLNFWGAAKASTWLARYLRDEYDLPDNRSAPYAARWDADLAQYQSVFGKWY
ncbi:MAG: hypothetical protein HGB10_10960 [Coriobacteriia bacterium]|nr:hypothetical protein [Coriobacteriia bacterium]